MVNKENTDYQLPVEVHDRSQIYVSEHRKSVKLSFRITHGMKSIESRWNQNAFS